MFDSDRYNPGGPGGTVRRVTGPGPAWQKYDLRLTAGSAGWAGVRSVVLFDIQRLRAAEHMPGQANDARKNIYYGRILM